MAPHELPSAASEGFKNASAYDAHRPSYPAEAVDALLRHLNLTTAAALATEPAGNEVKGPRIVEIAAGTGKFTELLAARPERFEIVATEPLASMRDQLEAKKLPTVTVKEGHAGGIPVADGWGDACIAAQSFHWFATPETLAEVHRVLRPGAVFGLIWNIEDYNKPACWPATTRWEQTLNDWIYSIAHDGHPRFRDEQWEAVFEKQLPLNPLQALKDSLTSEKSPKFSLPLGKDSVRWTVWLTEKALWARINTLSQVALLEGAEKERAERVFGEALRSEDVERNERGEIALHGVTFFAWTSSL